LDIVAGNDLIEKGQSLILAHISNTEKTLTLSHMTFVVGRSLLVGRIVLTNGPVVLRPFLKDEDIRRLMSDCARLSGESNSSRSGADNHEIFHVLGLHTQAFGMVMPIDSRNFVGGAPPIKAST